VLQKNKSNSNGFESIYVLNDLSEPTARNIQDVMEWGTAGLDATVLEKFRTLVGSQPPSAAGLSLHEVLWAASTLFGQVRLTKFNKRVLMFTNQDNPCPTSDLRERALQKANVCRYKRHTERCCVCCRQLFQLCLV
jgi:hypothetical protein